MVSTRQPDFEEIPGRAPDIMRDYDLATLGYEETEFSVEGTAVSYELAGRAGDGRSLGRDRPAPRPRSAPGSWCDVPSTPDRFSGTAVVEWHNVSAGIDAAPDWGFFHRHLAAQGHAWVGVSAQKVGIDGGGFVEGIHLKLLAPERYGDLEHPGDAWSFDIFTQVACVAAVPGDENPLGGLVPETVIAAGESQSAACLVTYINAIDPHAQLFDGFFVHGRPGVGVSIDGVFIPSARGEGIEATRRAISAKGERIRQDVRVPVLVLQSETDVILLGGGLADQPDSEHIRVWEMAGAAHADTYTISAGRHDDGTLSPERLAELLRPTTNLHDREHGHPRSTPARSSTTSRRPHWPTWCGGSRAGEPPPDGAPAGSRRGGNGLPAGRARPRARRHSYPLGGRADRADVRSRAERRVVRHAFRPHRALRRGDAEGALSRGPGRVPGAIRGLSRRRHRRRLHSR